MKKENRFLFWAVVVVGLGILSWIIIALATPDKQGSTTVTDQEWFKGSENAPVTLVEYSDFECPACASYYPMIKMLSEEMGSQVKIIYRHFPLSSIHPQAELAAQAAEAAGIQGQFWQMHDMLFENQAQWSNNSDAKNIFIGYAQELELNVEQFENDLESDAVKDAVRADKISGNQAFVQGTPSFFLNGEKINNPKSYDQFRQLIQNESN